MGLEQNVDTVKKSITTDVWRKAKSRAALRGIKIGDWLTEAIIEKYNREVTEEKHEKSI